MLMALWLFGLTVLGLVALAPAMDRHHETLARPWRGQFARSLLRLVGMASLAGALLCAVADAGLSQGVILSLGVLTPSALLVVSLLALGFDRHRP